MRPTLDKARLRKGIYILPSLFTTGNVFCGFYAFVAALNEKFTVAAWALVVAIIFDILDGRVARLTKTTSAFGVQYDSLADIISFGMAPAFLVYCWVLKPFGRMGWMAAFLFLLCGALRLARFNVSKPDIRGKYFLGLPIPAAAGVVASIVLTAGDIWPQRAPAGIMVAIVYTLAFLMVSNIKYPALKQLEFKKRVPFTRFLFVVLFVYVFITIPKITLFIVSVTYLLLGPLSMIYQPLHRKLISPELPPDEKQADSGNPANPR
jgi:CDP-diacylglycerol--serine O-phosphatidyltransferase